MPWWDPRGDCPKNCSFVAGEPSGAFWTLAPAALTPPAWRALAYGASLAFGACIAALASLSAYAADPPAVPAPPELAASAPLPEEGEGRRPTGGEPIHCFCFAVGVKGAGDIDYTNH